MMIFYTVSRKKEISYTTQVDTGINQAIQWRIF